MAKTYRRILIFIVILGVLMGLLGKKFAGENMKIQNLERIQSVP